ncbi:hypothetical protein OS493_037930 [Desmophyllum pertusum]|uniref:Uncharacterized protein n=1 Tax=Desmophyllum pertusum TaxID=174260 RepID=A0A9W9Y788_9CNID|nr:hypothetical protein OS493_037930 [Desmophyllum pertusum]
MRISHHVDHFQENWCRIRRARVDLDSLLKPCFYNISWNGDSPNRQLQTDAAKSLISFFDIRPAGQFSRFSIQTKTRDDKLKLIGGDSWRVLLRGPATVSPTVFDHGNGTYEFLFLVMDPGVYKLDMTLDYSLCDGYRDPPKNWFIVGNSHGKMQKDGTLGVNRAKDDYLLQPFQEGKLIMINIPMPRDGDISSYPKDKKPGISPSMLETLWIYGDSQGERLHLSIKDGPLCTEIFKSCNLSKNVGVPV